MKDTLVQICALQPQYSSANTAEMQERGRLIRTILSQDLRDRLPRLQAAFDPVIDDLAVDASDGMGRKTEAPWVRLFSKTLSPNPREGFYLVIHFTANGSAVYITVGCGSTVWSGGDLRPVSNMELQRRTSWARSIVEQKWRTTAPFLDEIHLGAKASLPQTFEKATAFAKRIDVADLERADLDGLLFAACERLGEIYLAQMMSKDVSQGDQDSDEVAAIARPLRAARRRQGTRLSAADRKAVELQAMRLATEYLTAEGYVCKDMSATESFDILASKAGLAVKIEVKGTTSDLCDSVLMTKNEVALHQSEKGQTGLLIVSRIVIEKGSEVSKATGGVLEALIGWDIDQWKADAIAFQVSRP